MGREERRDGIRLERSCGRDRRFGEQGRDIGEEGEVRPCCGEIRLEICVLGSVLLRGSVDCRESHCLQRIYLVTSREQLLVQVSSGFKVFQTIFLRPFVQHIAFRVEKRRCRTICASKSCRPLSSSAHCFNVSSASWYPPIL
jgi:hypothetical protein